MENGVLTAVKAIKTAILESQYRAAKGVNIEQLSLYFGIGRYISEHSRKGFWGTGAIEQISERLQKELPGLRGFSARSIKKMRTFYEEWQPALNSAAVAAELPLISGSIAVASDLTDSEIVQTQLLLPEKRTPVAAELDFEEFASLSFTHHMEILSKAKDINERIFYIHQTFLNQWDKYALRDILKADLFHHQRELYGQDQYPDLLFYNRELAALVAVELKRGEFKPAYLGQLSAYLRILDDKVKKPFENPSIGIILCKQANKNFVEYLIQGYENPMGVATYKTEKDVRKVLPTEEELARAMDEDSQDK